MEKKEGKERKEGEKEELIARKTERAGEAKVLTAD